MSTVSDTAASQTGAVIYIAVSLSVEGMQVALQEEGLPADQFTALLAVQEELADSIKDLETLQAAGWKITGDNDPSLGYYHYRAGKAMNSLEEALQARIDLDMEDALMEFGTEDNHFDVDLESEPVA